MYFAFADTKSLVRSSQGVAVALRLCLYGPMVIQVNYSRPTLQGYLFAVIIGGQVVSLHTRYPSFLFKGAK